MSDVQNGNCPIAVILDANIYFGDPALRNPDALVLLHHLKKIGGKLALPEVTRLEVEQRIHLVGEKYEKAIEQGLDYFSRLQNKKLHSPHGKPDVWIDGFQARMKEIDPVIIPVSDPHLWSAFRRVIAKTPPNTPDDQQLKDSLLWEAAIELAQTYCVIIVAFDNDFRDGKADNKLAPNLADEAAKTPCGIQIFRNLPACIETLKAQSAPINEAQFLPVVDAGIRSEVDQNIQQLKFALNDITGQSLKFYALDTPALVSVVFELRCLDHGHLTNRIRTKARQCSSFGGGSLFLQREGKTCLRN